MTIRRMSFSVRPCSGVNRSCSSSTGLALTYRSSLKRRPSRISAACWLEGTRGSPSAPNKMASNSSRSISTAPSGRLMFSRRYLSAPQSNSTNSMARCVAAVTVFNTFTASGVTSFPMPSPGITAIRAAVPPRRRGNFSKAFSIPFTTFLGQPFCARSELFDAVAPRLKPDARTLGNSNRSTRRHGHFRFNNILCPIAFAGGDVAGQREIRKCGERDVVRASDARFQHAAAPHRHGGALAQIMNALRDAEAAHTAQLDIYNFARAERDGGPGLLFRVDALVETDGGVQFFLQLDVAVEIVPSEGLLDHHQVEAFELFQQRPVFQAVSGVGVDHQFDARKILPQPANEFQVLPRLNFDFDALVSCVN